MGNLDTIAIQRTPGRPIQTSFGPQLGEPTSNQNLVLIGHMSSTGVSTTYKAINMVNVAVTEGSLAEATGYFGQGSELAAMVAAAVAANQATGNFPAITCIPLPRM